MVFSKCLGPKCDTLACWVTNNFMNSENLLESPGLITWVGSGWLSHGSTVQVIKPSDSNKFYKFIKLYLWPHMPRGHILDLSIWKIPSQVIGTLLKQVKPSQGNTIWDAAHQRFKISHDVKETQFPVKELKSTWLILVPLSDCQIPESDNKSDSLGPSQSSPTSTKATQPRQICIRTTCDTVPKC